MNEVADRIDELRAVLGVDRVADFVRRRQFEHLRRTLSASLEFGVLEDAEREFRELIAQARTAIDEKRRAIHRQAQKAAKARHESVLRNSGVWGVAQAQNKPWVGFVSDWRDFAAAVLMQDEVQRPTQILSVRRAIEAVSQPHVPEGAETWRPLWWAHVVQLGGCHGLRSEPGCEPFATDTVREAMRACLLEFADDPIAAASWRFQRVMIPLITRVVGLAPIEEIVAHGRAQRSAAALLEFEPTPSWFFGHAVRSAAVRQLAAVDPWTVEELDRKTAETAAMLERMPVPSQEWLAYEQAVDAGWTPPPAVANPHARRASRHRRVPPLRTVDAKWTPSGRQTHSCRQQNRQNALKCREIAKPSNGRTVDPLLTMNGRA